MVTQGPGGHREGAARAGLVWRPAQGGGHCEGTGAVQVSEVSSGQACAVSFPGSGLQPGSPRPVCACQAGAEGGWTRVSGARTLTSQGRCSLEPSGQAQALELHDSAAPLDARPRGQRAFLAPAVPQEGVGGGASAHRAPEDGKGRKAAAGLSGSLSGRWPGLCSTGARHAQSPALWLALSTGTPCPRRIPRPRGSAGLGRPRGAARFLGVGATPAPLQNPTSGEAAGLASH